ncbi:MAG: glycosyltransferase [Thermodesulfobacteriota bacterium]
MFLGNINDYYSRARLLISRAGASTICETKNCDLINILVPIKNSTNNHQYHNALEMNEKGLAEIWQENDQNLVLTNKIFNLLSKKDKAREILSNKKNQSNDYSAKNIVKEILKDG